MHAPLTHDWPAAHTLPHEPQFEASLASSTHAPPHTVAPLGHD
jgi:hypothetical protein